MWMVRRPEPGTDPPAAVINGDEVMVEMSYPELNGRQTPERHTKGCGVRPRQRGYSALSESVGRRTGSLR